MTAGGGTATEQVGRAADALLVAFGSHDRERYFSAFAPDATFCFHSTAGLLGSRAEYEALWKQWEGEGFRVEGCAASERRLDVLTPDVVLLTHRVRTRLAGVPEALRERESILFRREPDGRWLAVHEHLSCDPGSDADAGGDA